MELKTFLTTLHTALGDNETFQWHITRKGDTLKMAFIPELDSDTSVPKEAEAVRAALSLPLVFTGKTPDELAEGIAEQLSNYGQSRKQALDAFNEVILALKDATATAKNTVAEKSKKGKKTDKTKSDSGSKASATPKTEKKEAKKPSDEANPTPEDAKSSNNSVLDF